MNFWEKSVKLDADTPKCNKIDKFLSLHYHTLESVYDIRNSLPNANPNQAGNSRTGNPKKSLNVSKMIKSFAPKTKPSIVFSPCSLCQEQRPLRLCPTFLGQRIDERLAMVKKLM